MTGFRAPYFLFGFIFAILVALGAYSDVGENRKVALSDEFLDQYESIFLRIKDGSSDSSPEREFKLSTKSLLLEGENLLIVAPKENKDPVLAPLEKRVLDLVRGTPVEYSVSVIPFSRIASFNGAKPYPGDQARFRGFGRPNMPEFIPEGGPMAIRGPRTLLRKDWFARKPRRRDHFGRHYSFTVDGRVKHVLITERGILVNLEDYSQLEVRATTDHRLLDTSKQIKSMQELARIVQYENRGQLEAFGTPRDFTPGQVRRSMIPSPEESVIAFVMVDRLQQIPGPIIIQDRFVTLENGIYLPELGVQIPFERIIGLFDYVDTNF